MHGNRKATAGIMRARSVATAVVVAATVLAGCERGSSHGPGDSPTGSGGCPAVQDRAETAVGRTRKGPTSPGAARPAAPRQSPARPSSTSPRP